MKLYTELKLGNGGNDNFNCFFPSSFHVDKRHISVLSENKKRHKIYSLPYKRFMESGNKKGKHEHPLPQEISKKEKNIESKAHREAEKDIEQDADFSAQSPNDDLDEGETARLGENTDLV